MQLDHINTLSRMLGNVRKSYLNVDSRTTTLSRQASRNMDLGSLDNSLAGIRHLTNEERDQVDMQARVILTRCARRVRQLEDLEKRADHYRLEFYSTFNMSLVSGRAELVSSRSNPLTKWIPTRLMQNEKTVLSDF